MSLLWSLGNCLASIIYKDVAPLELREWFGIYYLLYSLLYFVPPLLERAKFILQLITSLWLKEAIYNKVHLENCFIHELDT